MRTRVAAAITRSLKHQDPTITVLARAPWHSYAVRSLEEEASHDQGQRDVPEHCRSQIRSRVLSRQAHAARKDPYGRFLFVLHDRQRLRRWRAGQLGSLRGHVPYLL